MSMKQRLKSHVSTLVLGSLLLGVAAYEWKQVKDGSVIASAQALPAPGKPTNVLAEGRMAVAPGAEITVGAELGGKLTQLMVKEQDRVNAGDLLAEVDVKEQRAALNEAWARVKAENSTRHTAKKAVTALSRLRRGSRSARAPYAGTSANRSKAWPAAT